MASSDDVNWLVRNQGINPSANFNFMLRVEALFDLPCKTVRAFTKANEFEYIQEGGLNDYVHMRRKPISQPFTFEVDRYVGVDYIDPLPLGAEPILPILLLVFPNTAYRKESGFLRMYTFTGCTVMEKTYGELNAEQSGLYVETTKISYRECVIITAPDPGKHDAYKEGDKSSRHAKTPTNDAIHAEQRLWTPLNAAPGTEPPKNSDGTVKVNPENKSARYIGDTGYTVVGKTGSTIYAPTTAADGTTTYNAVEQAANDNMHRGRYDGMGTAGAVFTKAKMKTGQFAVTPPKDSDRAVRRLWTPLNAKPGAEPPKNSDGTVKVNPENKSARHIGDAGLSVVGNTGGPIYGADGKAIGQSANDNVHRGRYDGMDASGAVFSRDKMRTGQFASIPPKDSDRAVRRIYPETVSARHIGDAGLSVVGNTGGPIIGADGKEIPQSANDNVNRGRYENSEAGHFAVRPPEDQGNANEMNRGRYDGMTKDSGLTWDAMNTVKFAAPGSKSAPKAESRLYVEGQPDTMSHLDRAGYLARKNKK